MITPHDPEPSRHRVQAGRLSWADRLGVAAPPAPERVRAQVRRAERAAEVLTSTAQLAGVVLFAGLYLLSRREFELRGGPEPVPIALIAYAGFTLLRLRLALAGRLGEGLATLSSVLDVAVLTTLLWSFTVQYGAPPALYLKAPTLLYVFVLIALRALRFSPRQVLVTGISAAVGWSCLVALAAFGPEPAPVTRSYPEHLQSLSLLWGAEFEKVGVILAVTAVLALAVARARALLVRTAVEADAAAELSRFVGRPVAERVRAAELELQPGDGEIRFAAIMMVDLRGFTPMTAGWAASEVVGLLREHQAWLAPLIEAGGGTVDKYLGDGVLVSFGAASPTGRECADALATGLSVMRAAAAWTARRQAAGLAAPEVAAAVSAGPVVWGVVGAGDRLEYTVIGDAVNLAAKLEKHAKGLGARLLVTAEALARAERQGFAPPPTAVRRPGEAVAGGAQPVDLVILA
jgi:adenylate cyclase